MILCYNLLSVFVKINGYFRVEKRMNETTIVAIATALGEAGIGIVRMSGKDAFDIASKIIRNKKNQLITEFRHQRFYYGHVCDIKGEKVDEVMVVGFHGPKSYTCEDVIEIHSHGNAIILNRILEILINAGATLAEPGEFTKRAFLNGRLDLTQAEAVMDLISAKSSQAAKCSLRQLEGNLSKQINEIKNNIMAILAHIEVAIDLPEDDIEADNEEAIKQRIHRTLAKIDVLLATENMGRMVQDGIHIALIGKPNVGKSSLLNCLVGQEKAIVTDIPGTTRDVIEQQINIDGFSVKFIDTAGLRDTQDLVEKIGVERSQSIIEKSDCLFIIFDVSKPVEEKDLAIYEQYKDYFHVVLLNKTDKEINEQTRAMFNKSRCFEVSAAQGIGIDKIRKWIADTIIEGNLQNGTESIIFNQRILTALKQARNSLLEAKEAIKLTIPIDIMSIDVREAAEKIGEITGETISDDLVDLIFCEFCVGK